MIRNEILIKCRLCNQFHDYEFHIDNINGFTAQWNSLENLEALLDNRPEVGNRYALTLLTSLRLRIDTPFWVLYQNPYSTLNGIDNEEDIIDMAFCKCKFVKLIHQEEYIAKIEVQILEIKELNSLTSPYKPTVPWWTLYADYQTYQKHGTTENFDNYSLISINIQSDVGIDLIILKESGESRIIALNDWDFHLNEWNLCSIKLTKEDEQKYGIQH